ncbi:MAG: family 43 glycosylhydrolase [Limisphaerales bacterium]
MRNPRGSAPGAKDFQPVVINNVEPRRDLAGEIVDAHDGCLQFFAGRYYLYGTAYGKTAGFSINNRFRVYSSPDLQRWTFEGELLQSPPDGVYYRPYVVFNPRTRKYVLWYNWYPKLWDGQNGVAASDSPAGPFQIANDNVQLSQSRDHPGDGSLFVDEDGTGYFIYTVIGQGHAIRVEKLTPDYLASTGETSAVLADGCEAPVLFRRQQIYYALFDLCCCFCPSGSGARVYSAASPLGPFTERSNINRVPEGNPAVAAQQTWVATIPTADGPALIWMGDRWGSRPDGVKGHDFQFWSAPLRFGSDDNIRPIENVPTWQANVQVGGNQLPHGQVYLWPKKKDPRPVTVDPCSGEPIPREQRDGLP